MKKGVLAPPNELLPAARIVTVTPSEDFLSRWADDLKLSNEMYREAGIEGTYYDLNEINLESACITVAPGGCSRA